MRTDEERNFDADIQGADPPPLVKFAASLQGVTGLLVALLGLQMWSASIHGRAAWVEYVPFWLMLLGVAGLAMASAQFRARRWAAIGSAALASLTALSMVAWFLYVGFSVISCFMLVGVPLSCLSALLSLAAIGGVLSTAAARQRLADRGVDLGL